MKKNPHAVALGKIKSKEKAEAARKNGTKPCKPGKKRGRPFKLPKNSQPKVVVYFR